IVRDTQNTFIPRTARFLSENTVDLLHTCASFRHKNQINQGADGHRRANRQAVEFISILRKNFDRRQGRPGRRRDKICPPPPPPPPAFFCSHHPTLIRRVNVDRPHH